MKHNCIMALLIVSIGIAYVNIVQADEVKRSRNLVLDDGNVIEEIETDTEQYENAIEHLEKGTHQFGRRLLKPFISAASRIGKAFNFVSVSTGLDTNSSFVGGAMDSFKSHIKMIYPGTRWCGDGDKARTEDDLGTFETTDKCCRGHDKCFDFIAAGKTKYGLNNTGLFTRSHCNCDTEFYSCLKNATDMIARKIGFTYFTVLGPQCFKEEYLVTGCIQFSRGKCIEYRTDEARGKLFQWFDSPMFL